MIQLNEIEVQRFTQLQSQATPGNYAPIYKELADLLTGKYNVSLTDSAVLWLRGATEANAGRGAFSALIRSYTETQYQLRYGMPVPFGKLQEASDAVAKNLLRDLTGGNPLWPRGQMPDIRQISLADATAVSDVLFGPRLGHADTDTAFSQNSAWSGSLLFSLLRSDQTGRLMSTGNGDAIDTLNDWRDVLYAYKSYEAGLKAAVTGSAATLLISQTGSPAQRALAATTIATDTLVMGATVYGYVSNGGTGADLQQTIINGTANPLLKSAFQTIGNTSPNLFLDMVMGAVQGKSVLGSTTDANFNATAKAFLGALSPAQLQAVSAKLLPSSADAITRLARTDANTRAALAAGSIVKLQVSSAIANSEALGLYNPATGQGSMTEQYLADRALFVVALGTGKPDLARETWRSATLPQDKSFEFRYQDVNAAEKIIIAENTARAGGVNRPVPSQFIAFGGDGADTLVGSSNRLGDHLYGGAGNDSLDGKAGNDYLEGGKGADTYIFTSQWGNDIIIDSDGLGSIVLDGTVLSGGKKQSATIWRSDDNKTEYHFNLNTGSAVTTTDVGTLRIYRTGLSDGVNGITVRNYKLGDLNLTLSSSQAALPRAPAGYSSENRLFGGDIHGVVDVDTDGKLFYNPAAGMIGDSNFADVLINPYNAYDNVSADGGGGNDLLFGNFGHDKLYGDDGNDWLLGGAGLDTLNGGAGNDIISDLLPAYFAKPVNAGPQDHWDAPAGVTVLARGTTWGVYSNANGQIKISSSISGVSTEHIGLSIFSFSNDPFDERYPNWGNDIDAGSGNDIVFAGLGSDSVVLGEGDDLAYGFAGNDDIDGGQGNDRIYGDRETITRAGLSGFGMLPGTGGSFVVPTNGDDYLDGGEGDDTLYGDYGNNTLIGGAGNDILVGGTDFALGSQQQADNMLIAGADVAVATIDGSDDARGINNLLGAGNHYLDGGDGDDILIGGALADTLLGGTGNDYLYGGFGDDYLNGGAGSNVLVGGGGNDTLVASKPETELPVTNTTGLARSAQTTAATTDETTAALTILEGGEGNDTFIISAGAGEVIIRANNSTPSSQSDPNAPAQPGSDRIVIAASAASSQWKADFAGDDLVIAFKDPSTGQGESAGQGAGDISIRLEGYFDFSTNNATAFTQGFEFEDGGTVSIVEVLKSAATGTEGGDVLLGALTPGGVDGAGAVLDGGEGDDEIYGTQANDTIYGGTGGDLINGLDGQDVAYGGEGSDVLYGGDGNDALYGESGNDILYGGTGIDLLAGGAGNDTYVFDIADRLPGGQIEMDVISDVAGNDLIRLGDDLALGDVTAYQDSTQQWRLYWNGGAVRIDGGNDGASRIKVEIASVQYSLQSLLLPGRPDRPITITEPFNAQANTDFLAAVRDGVRLDVERGVNEGLLISSESSSRTQSWMTKSSDAAYLDTTLPGSFTVQEPTYTVTQNGYKDKYGRWYDTNEILGFAPKTAFPSGSGISKASLAVFLRKSIGGGSVTVSGWTVAGQTGFYAISGIRNDVSPNIVRTVSGYETVTTSYQSAYATDLTLGAGANTASISAGLIQAGAGDDELRVLTSNGPPINGDYAKILSRLTPRNETFLSGKAYLSFTDGGEGNDVIYGSTLSDVLYGGTGNNSLYGRTGADRYLVLARADGDTSYDYIADTLVYQGQHDDLAAAYGGPADEVIPTGADIDTVEFGPGIRLDELHFSVKTRQSDSRAFTPAQNYEFDNSQYLPPPTEEYLVVERGGSRLAAISLITNGQAGSGIEFLEFQDGQKKSVASVLAEYNQAPLLASALPDATAQSAQLFNYVVSPLAFESPNGQALTISITLADGSALPEWLQISREMINGNMRTVLSGTPSYEQVGHLNLRITATNEAGKSVSDQIDLNVESTNRAPVVTALLESQIAIEGQSFVWHLPANTFTDEDLQDVLTWSFTPSDPAVGQWLSFNAATKVFSGVPQFADLYRTVEGTLTATDSYGATASQQIVVHADELMGISVVGTSANDVLVGTAGSDSFDGLEGTDTMKGGKGQDGYIVNSVGDIVVEKAGEGHDYVDSSISYTLTANVEDLYLSGDNDIDGTGNSLDNLVAGSEGANKLQGAAGNDFLYGNGGDDWLRGGTGVDHLEGNLGDDLYEVDNALDTVVEWLDEGIDTVEASVTFGLSANVENLILTGANAIDGIGNELDNNLQGSDAANVLMGAAGDDTLNGKKGADTLIGGMGNDTYLFEDDVDQIVEAAGGGRDVLISRFAVTLAANVEDGVLLGSAADLIGNELSNVLTGNSAANTIDGGAGADVMLGGKGNDLYVVDSQADTIIENAAEGTDTVQASVNYSLADNVEHLTLTGTAEAGMGNSLNNKLTGNGSSNKLFGDAGNDEIDGGSGADIMVGGLGNDKYWVDSFSDLVVEDAGEGTDTVYASVSYALADNVESLVLTGISNINGIGNAGNNRIEGNAGNNILFGGLGSDTYVFGRGSGHDIIANFDAGKPSGDLVQLGAGIVSADLDFVKAGNDLVLSIKGTSDQLTVASYFENGGKGSNALEKIRFADGTSLNHAAVLSLSSLTANVSDAQTLPAGVRTGDATALFDTPNAAATKTSDAAVTPQTVAESIAAARQRFEQGLQQLKLNLDEQGSLSRREFAERRALPLLWNLQDALLNLQLAKNPDGRFTTDVSIDSRATRDLGLGITALGAVNGSSSKLDQVTRPQDIQQFDLAQMH